MKPQTGLSGEDLVRICSMDSSKDPYVKAVRNGQLALDPELIGRLKMITRPITWSKRNTGIGYLSSSLRHDQDKEILYTVVIADAFKNREELETEPLIVPIDMFYSYVPGNASLVSKTKIFNEEIGGQKRHAIILTDFSGSQVFTSSVLEQVPTQSNAGLDIDNPSYLGKKLMDSSRKISLFIGRNNGDVKKTLDEIAEYGELEDARLLFATSLLLKDMQKWQDLWYEGRDSGTPLCIIAPKTFHDSMNRLNFSWGHGVADYHYRASASLGANDFPPFEEEQGYIYHNLGLSHAEFKKRVEPLLDRIIAEEAK